MHQGPDGDAVGSSLAWSLILQKLGLNTSIIAPDAFADFLKWMPGADHIIIFDKNEEKGTKAIAEAQIIFCLDFNAIDRMSLVEGPVSKSEAPIVVIDHHRFPTAFAKYYYTNDKACSTAELIYRLVLQMGYESLIDIDIATGLYAGIVTDTGSFRFPSVTPEVMRIGAALMEKGLNHADIHMQLFDSNTEDMTRLRGYALSEKLVVIPEAATAYISLSDAELKRFNNRKGYTEGLVNQALAIKGVHLAALFTEGDGLIKISLRSHGKMDVNQLARTHFNGGGHINAAGGRSHSSLAHVIKEFEDIAKNMALEISAAV